MALGGPAHRTLATPAQGTQNPPHMARMKLLSSLSFDQIGHPPGGPQSGAITQRLGAFFETPAQLFQLHGLQARFAAGSAGFLKRFGSFVLPGLVPAADRLAVHMEFAGYLGLAQALVEEFGGFESPLFQLIKIAFDAFGITHAQRLP